MVSEDGLRRLSRNVSILILGAGPTELGVATRLPPASRPLLSGIQILSRHGVLVDQVGCPTPEFETRVGAPGGAPLAAPTRDLEPWRARVVSNQDHAVMLSVEAVDSILFGTRNVTLELANVVNKTENAQRGLNPDLQPRTKSTRSTSVRSFAAARARIINNLIILQ